MRGDQNFQTRPHESRQQVRQLDLVGRIEMALWLVNDEEMIFFCATWRKKKYKSDKPRTEEDAVCNGM